MNTAAKIILKTLLVFVSVVVLCAIVFAIMFARSDPNQYKSIVRDKILEMSGADLTINGNFDVSAFPTPGVVMQDVVLINGQDLTVKAKTVHMDFDLMSLFTTEYKVKRFDGKDVKITLRDKGKSPQSYFANELSGKFARTCCGFKLSSFYAKSKKGSIKGDLDVQTDVKRPLIKGNLTLNDVTPGDFIIEATSNSSSSNKMIPEIPIPFNLFESFDFDLQVKLENLLLEKPIKKGNFKLTSTMAKAKIAPFSIEYLGGNLDGTIALESIGPGKGVLDVDLDLKQGSLDALLNESTKVKGGRFSLHFDGKGHGQNIREIMSRWNGSADWSLKDASIDGQGLDSNFTDAFLGFLNPFAKKERNTQIQCAVLRFDIKKGTAFAINKVALETKRFDILGSGKIDLGTEAIDFEFNMRKKSGIEFNVGNFDNYIRLSGNLSEPKLVANPKGILQDGLSLFATVASGGLSLVAEQLFDKIGDKGSPCSLVENNK